MGRRAAAPDALGVTHAPAAGTVLRMEPSESALRHRLESDPSDTEAGFRLGVLLIRSRRYAEAIHWLESVAPRLADPFDASIWISIAHRSQEEGDLAVGWAEQAVALRPDSSVAHHTLGQAYLVQRRPADAIPHLARAIELAPTEAPAHHDLGLALQMEDRYAEAEVAFRRGIALSPNDPQGYVSLADLLIPQLRSAAAIEILEAARKIHPHSPAVLSRLSKAYALDRQPGPAERFFRRAEAFDPTLASAYGLWLQEEGRTDESIAAFRRSIAAQPRQGYAYYGLAQAAPRAFDEDTLKRMGEVALDPTLPPRERMYLAYVEAQQAERGGDFGAASEALDRANDLAFRLHNAGRPFDAAELRAVYDSRVAAYQAGTIPHVPTESETPIFIVGMVRSGTTLLEQILSAHPEVGAAGELRFWIEDSVRPMPDSAADAYERILRHLAPERRHVTDKMPLNFAHLGVIHRTFSNARILHLRRHPVDTCLSIYATYMGPAPVFAYHRERIVAYYQAYRQIMAAWRSILPPDRFLEVDYETLVENPEPTVRQVLAFCGLDWDPACLHPETNPSAIRTPSLWQARRPISKRSVERWRAFEPWLGEFRTLLSD